MKTTDLLPEMRATRKLFTEKRHNRAAPSSLSGYWSSYDLIQTALNAWPVFRFDGKKRQPEIYSSREWGEYVSRPVLTEAHALVAKAIEHLRRNPHKDLVKERWNPCGTITVNGQKAEIDVYPRNKSDSTAAILRLTHYDHAGHKHITEVLIHRLGDEDLAVVKTTTHGSEESRLMFNASGSEPGGHAELTRRSPGKLDTRTLEIPVVV